VVALAGVEPVLEGAELDGAATRLSPAAFLVVLEGLVLPDRRRRALSTANLTRGMERWTVEDVQRHLDLGARTTPFALRKARRRPDFARIRALLE